MRAAILQGDTVINIIEVQSLAAHPGAIAALNGAIGDKWDGVRFIKPAAPKPVVPESVPALNAELTLIDAGLMEAVDAYFDSLTGTEGARARAFRNRALNWRRDDPWVESIRSRLGMTHQQIDALFIDAAGRG